ncbi:hypothetical protein MMC26_007009 [Xylographa opegraphella]|nr:hypothetical protein [Xylographa opegraphella]
MSTQASDTATSSSPAHNPLSIAILDDYLSIAPPFFTHILNLTIHTYPSTLHPSSLPALISRLAPYPIISTMRERTPFSSALLSSLPNLRLLLTTGTRNASFDLPTASSLSITIAGTTGTGPSRPTPALDHVTPPPPPGFDATTQQTWALILALANNIPRDSTAFHSGAWQTGFNTGVAGKVLGVVGLGRLGARVAKIGTAFGMHVVAWSASLTQESADAQAQAAGLPAGTFRAVSKEELFRTADVVTLHLVLGERSRGVVGEGELRAMKRSAVLVNTARAGLVDEEALLGVMREGAISGVGLDVWWEEPVGERSVWRTERWGVDGKSVLVGTPHMGYVEEGVMKRWYAEQAENVERWIRGEEVRNRIV